MVIEAVCRCNNCWTYYYDDLRDNDDETLILFPDGPDFSHKGCLVCKTDGYLIDIDICEIEITANC
jgi:hypothetical protein